MVEFAGIVDESLKVLKNEELRLELSIGLTKSLQFYYLIYDKFNNKVGQCGIRLLNNDKNNYLGNIEYEIFSQYRGNNYAEKASRLLAKVALYHNIDRITVTANPNNLASIKTIENLGAKFIEIRKVPKKMRLYKTSKEINVYELKLER